MLAMAECQSTKILPMRTSSRASSAPTVGGGVSVDEDIADADACGSRACSRWRWISQRRCCRCGRLREQALLLQWGAVGQSTKMLPVRTPVGAELARDGGGSVDEDVADADVFASKLCSYSGGRWVSRRRCCWCERLWEPSLLAMAVGQSTKMLPVRTPVGASFSPTVGARDGLQLTERFHPAKASAKVRGFFKLSLRKGPA